MCMNDINKHIKNNHIKIKKYNVDNKIFMKFLINKENSLEKEYSENA